MAKVDLSFFAIFLSLVVPAIALATEIDSSETNSGVKIVAPQFNVNVLRMFPHNPGNWTEGLVFDQGTLIEGTGEVNRTHIDRVDPSDGRVLKSVDVPNYYGEGITVFGDRIIQLTYTEMVGFYYDLTSFLKLGSFNLNTHTQQGWGLTQNGESLIESDGSSTLYFLDPLTYATTRTLQVTDDNGNPVESINELEYVNGEIFANIWPTDQIVIISSTTGKLVGSVDGSHLQLLAGSPVSYLNGIAYDPMSEHFYLTGKLWPISFEVTFDQK